MKGKMILFLGVAVLALGISSAPAHALSLTPADADWTITQNGNCNATCFFNLSGLTLTENYKQDAGGPESGSLLGSYTTTFNADLSGFTIVYDGGSTFDCPTCVLYVKDGSPRPQYFFNLGDWNGTETITGSGFYPEQGAISHVSILGGVGTSVPEPASLMLLGAGLAGIGVWRRKSTKI